MPYENIQEQESVLDEIRRLDKEQSRYEDSLKMDIQQDFKFMEEEVEYQPVLTLDEAFELDDRIKCIEDLAEITKKMSKKDKMYDSTKPVIIAGQVFTRSDVEKWLITQEFENLDSDGANSPDSSLEADMKVFNVTKYVSLGDLLNALKGACIDIASLSEEDLREALWCMGLNNKDYTTIERNDTHRDQLNKPVTCLRYISEERQDKEWLQSGMASWEAKVAAAGDESLERELASIGRR